MLQGSYSFSLAFVSVFIATLASYLTLDLTDRIARLTALSTRRYWLYGGAISMGLGIWSMHFVGMLAFRLPIPMSYDITITLLSLLIAVMVSWIALHTVSHGILNARRLLGAGVSMGIGIAAMHYTGMAAMQMEPPIRY